MSDILSRDAILSAPDIKRELVEVPEWGGAVYVQNMTAAQRDDLEQVYLLPGGGGYDLKRPNFRAQVVARCCCDGEGRPLFTLEDVIALGAKSSVALDRLCDVALRISSMTEGAAGELGKN